MNRKTVSLVAAVCVLATAAFATSHYPLRPDDPLAVDVTPDRFPVHADGIGDDSAALQQAIDRVQETTRRGIVLLPAGRYRLTKTLRVWSGIRLIGYGATRPVLVLGENTPGFQSGSDRYLVHFVSDRPTTPDEPVRDANPGTFYSAISNIDLEIRDGNPAAVGVRAHFAQHCFLAHMDFHIGQGRAGVEEAGNEAEDVRFFGGDFGITMHKPSPSWPFLLIDARFEGQRRAAIETEEAGLTLVRTHFTRVPTAVLVRPERAEELWLKDCQLEEISGPALVISDEQNARTQVNLQNTVCARVPVLVQFRDSGQRMEGPAALYRVRVFTHGLQLSDTDPNGRTGATANRRDEGASPAGHRTTSQLEPLEAMPAPVPSDIAALPPMQEWVNLRSLGAKGDGISDDTAVLRRAIESHRAIYLPSGRYRVTEPIGLRPDTVLIGLNPITTQILLADFTPAFQGVNGPDPATAAVAAPARRGRSPTAFPGRGAPVPMLETPPGGTNIVTGLGLDTGGANNRAVALKWRAGEKSLVNDVRFLGGHGTYGPDGQWLPIYNDNRTADPDPRRRWDSQYWSLWVTEGGGGTFKDIWTPSPFAAAGMYVSDTTTPGRVYALSSEHHVRNEVILRRASNWQFHALQTEEERGESPRALPLELEDCGDILVANFFVYRVDLPVPHDTAIRVSNSRAIQFRGLHVYSPGKLSFDHTLVASPPSHLRVWAREVAALTLSGAAPAPPRPSRVEKVAGGFIATDGAAVNAAGDLFFVDQPSNRIHRWSPAASRLALVTDAVPQPVALAFDRADNLLIVSAHGNVYALPPGGSETAIQVLRPQPATDRPGATRWLPASRWRDSHDWIAANTEPLPWHYVSPDGSVVIPAPDAYAQMPAKGRGWGTIDLARTYALLPAAVGKPFYAADEFGQKTWRWQVQPDGALTAPELFAEEGEVGTAIDPDGNVYVGAGQILVYAPSGKLIDVIEIPERPSALAFGGAERRTLFICARTSLYQLRPTDHTPR